MAPSLAIATFGSGHQINYFKLLGSGPPEGLSRRTQEARASDKDSGNASSDSHQILIQIVTKEYRSLPTVDMENLISIQERRAVPSRAWHVCIHPPASPSPEAQGDISNAEPECWKLGEALHSALRRKQASECAAEYECRHDLY